MSIHRRKSEHLHIALHESVAFRSKTTGFEAYAFRHCALPEMEPDDIDLSVVFLGKTLRMPLMLSAMTGGCDEALELNSRLAEICAAQGLALGVGSMRPLLEPGADTGSYRIIRKRAPHAVLVGNVGAVQVAEARDLSPLLRLADLIEADAMAVHLNPLQEVIQPDGRAGFSGVLAGLEKLVRALPVPVMVKEVGCGISGEVASRLRQVGVQWVDVAGAGGTSWAGIESFRGGSKNLAERFWDWGIPTARCLEEMRAIPDLNVIASGGITGGMDMAKALALGAVVCGTALAALRRLMEGPEALTSMIEEWYEELKLVHFLTGSRDCESLRRPGVLDKVG